MKRLVTLLLLLAPTAEALTPELLTHTSSEGVTYHYATTGEGDVFIAPHGAPDDAYVLLPDCTARHVTLGTGIWGYANGGWLIEFPDRSIGFPRQEPPPVDGADCLLP